MTSEDIKHQLIIIIQNHMRHERSESAEGAEGALAQRASAGRCCIVDGRRGKGHVVGVFIWGCMDVLEGVS